MANQRDAQRACVLIPAYEEESSIGDIIGRIIPTVADVIVVDDGSPDQTAAVAREAGAKVLSHSENRGKGAALNIGFGYVREQGFDYVICMNGDGRHDPADIPRFIDAYVRTGIPVLIGNRMADPFAMPRGHRWINQFMSAWLSRVMGQYIPDTQCGFRLYRCEMLPFVKALDSHLAAESEILLHVAERGIRMGSVRITAPPSAARFECHPLRATGRFLKMLIRYYRRRHERPAGW